MRQLAFGRQWAPVDEVSLLRETAQSIRQASKHGAVGGIVPAEQDGDLLRVEAWHRPIVRELALCRWCQFCNDARVASNRGAVSGMTLAAIGVALFSATFPATTIALRGFDAVFIGAGRSVGAALLAGATLLLTRAPLPNRRQCKMLLACVPGVGIGYGVLTAIALDHVTASHAAVVTGLLPAATAVVATWRAGERPGRLFWAASSAAHASSWRSR